MKLYKPEELRKKFDGQFVDTYPHHHSVMENGRYITVYEVRGVSSKIRENYQTVDEIIKE